MRKQRERDHARHAAQTASERQLPHSRKVHVNAKEWQLKPLRETRLQRMRDRLAAETPEEREKQPSIACLMGSMPIADM